MTPLYAPQALVSCVLYRIANLYCFGKLPIDYFLCGLPLTALLGSYLLALACCKPVKTTEGKVAMSCSHSSALWNFLLRGFDVIQKQNFRARFRLYVAALTRSIPQCGEEIDTVPESVPCVTPFNRSCYVQLLSAEMKHDRSCI